MKENELTQLILLNNLQKLIDQYSVGHIWNIKDTSTKKEQCSERHTRLFLEYFPFDLAPGDMSAKLNVYILRNRGLEVIIHTKVKCIA